MSWRWGCCPAKGVRKDQGQTAWIEKHARARPPEQPRPRKAHRAQVQEGHDWEDCQTGETGGKTKTRTTRQQQTPNYYTNTQLLDGPQLIDSPPTTWQTPSYLANPILPGKLPIARQTPNY